MTAPTAPALRTLVAALLLTACGPPTSGMELVDPAEVPYRLLDEAPAVVPPEGDGSPGSAGPLVYWVDETDRLVPRRSGGDCRERAAEQVGTLLGELAAGPGTAVRDDGLGTAFPPGSGIELASLADGLAVVELQPESTISPDLLPAAVAQIVLTVTSVPSVDRVTLTSEGDTVQAPVPGGALATEPVGAADYVTLVPQRLRRSDQFSASGSRLPQRCRS